MLYSVNNGALLLFFSPFTLLQIYPWFSSLPNPEAEEYSSEKKSRVKTLNHSKIEENLELAENIRILNLRLRRLVHQGISDLVDPSR